jgi:mercuric ion binding protein
MKLPVAALAASAALMSPLAHASKPLIVVAAVILAVMAPAAAGERTVRLSVDNMSCDLCPITVKKSLTQVSGVRGADVSFQDKSATVRFDDGKTDVAALIAATTNAGYPSRPAP